MKKLLCLIISITLILAVIPASGAAPQEFLFLSVAEIAFSAVGESEDIYRGSVPADQVTWESENPAVISVKDGVLTAEGVGSTVIHASFGDLSVSCKASCLAENRNALLCLSSETLHKPKRIAPKVDIDPEDFFSDAVFIGDSVTYNLFLQEKQTAQLGHPLFLARKNISVHNFYRYLMNITYQGNELSLEEAVAATHMKKVFLMLGTNDLGYQTPQECAGKYGTLIDRIQEKAPKAQIYIQTCTPAYVTQPPFSARNADLDTFNELVTEIALKKGCVVIDLAAYFEDHINSMAACYTLDYDVHLEGTGCNEWMDVLRAYAYTESMK